MADYEPLIKPEELKSNLLSEAFTDKPHDFYIVYDRLMDELILKIVKPDHFVTVYYITDDYALLVDPETYEVVGIQFDDFSSTYSKNFKCASQIWSIQDFKEHFKQYVKLKWEPELSKPKRKNSSQDSYFFFPPMKIDRALATCQ